jgi:hypothetical protein
MNTSSLAQLEREAQVFGRHFIREQPTLQVIELYVRAMKHASSTPDKTERKLLNLMVHRPWTIGLVDSGLAVTNAQSEVRRRLYVMFAILESVPEYADKFLPKKRSPLYALFVLYACARSVVQAVIGIVLVKVAT